MCPGFSRLLTTPTPEQALQFSYDSSNAEKPGGVAPADLPEAIRQLRESDPGRKMYSAQNLYADIIKVDASASEQMQALAAETKQLFADLSLDNMQAHTVVDVFAGLTELPSAEQQAAWQQEALAEVFRLYSPREAADHIAEARALVARDPLVQRMLDESGLGSQPKNVKLLIEKARSEQGRGRLAIGSQIVPRHERAPPHSYKARSTWRAG